MEISALAQPDREPKIRGFKRLVDACDLPLVGLALFSILLYLTRLSGFFLGGAECTTYRTISSVIDLLFVADLLAKVTVGGRKYMRSPWFLIDVLSSLPALDLLTLELPEFDPLRVLRVLRIMRLLRAVRFMDSLRKVPALASWCSEVSAGNNPKLAGILNVGALSAAVLLMSLIIGVRQAERAAFVADLHTLGRANISSESLRQLGGTFEEPATGSSVGVGAQIDGAPRMVYFSLKPIDERGNRFEFFLVVGTLLANGVFVYLASSHLQQVSLGQLRALVNIALPSQVAKHFLDNPRAYSEKHRGPATILFMDFVGFTSTCERLKDLDQISEHLERSLDVVVAALARHDLIIDKFIGDAVMSFRGGPLVDGDECDHAYRVVRGALEASWALADLGDPYFGRMKIGGASTDDCLIGAFGASTRLSYTALGDGVNLAARLEPASGQCRTSNLFCQQTYRRCQGRRDLAWRRWGQPRVPGKIETVAAYEAFDLARLGDARWIATFDSALGLFERRAFAEARLLFLQCHAERAGGDEPSLDYARRCSELVAADLDDTWQPEQFTHE